MVIYIPHDATGSQVDAMQMTTTSTLSYLSNGGVRDDLYSVGGPNLSTPYILEQTELGWRTFYLDERGGENDILRFGTEDRACSYFCHWVMAEDSFSDPGPQGRPHVEPATMTIESLKHILELENVDPSVYVISGELSPHQIALVHSGDRWTVGTWARGRLNRARQFTSEDQASWFMYHHVVSSFIRG